MHIAFVTYVKAPGLTEDDKILAGYLREKNIVVTPVSWDDDKIEWNSFDAIVLRSMWDYFERPEEFDQWISQMASVDCTILNPPSVVRWNQDKNYFDDFSSKGFALPQYVICSKEYSGTLESIMVKNNWQKAVVKPAISGGAYNTWLTNIDSASSDEDHFRPLLQKGDVIVQQFVNEILTRGEVSLIFFDKDFSHAICKKASAGDFRVQSQFGGTVEVFHPDENILALATELVHSINEPLLYARVDGVINDDGDFLLMELELIEPSLFISTDANACENFYKALLKQLG